MGTPICVDAVTSKPAIERTFGHFARVLIDIDLSKELRYEVLVERKGYAFFVELEYENVPEFCDYCRSVGHHVSVCRKAGKRNNDGTHQENNKGEPTEKIQDKGKALLVKQNVVWTEKDTHVNDLDIENSSKQITQQDAGVADKDKGMKEGTQKTQQHEIDARNVNSPVAALNRNEELPADGQESEASTQESEFVDATQLNNDAADDHDSSQEQDSSARVRNNMHFLNQSWANLNDVDDELIKQQEADLVAKLTNEVDIEAQIQNETQSNIAASGFTLVTRKTNKKNGQKANNSKASASYLTRSKVPTKPLK